MSWLQIGLSKSGNFWLYQIIQSIAGKSSIEKKSIILNDSIQTEALSWELAFPDQRKIDNISITNKSVVYRIGTQYVHPITDPAEYASSCSHVWLHSPWCAKSHTVLKHFSKKVYIIRDPRDVAISLCHYALTPYRLKYFEADPPSKDPSELLKIRLESILETWAKHVGGYLKQGKNEDIYFIFYEKLCQNFKDEVKKLAEYLKMPVTDSDLQEFENELSFTSLQADNRSHLRKGTFGQWRNSLEQHEIIRANKTLGPLFDLLGYPRNESDCYDPDNLKIPSGNNLKKFSSFVLQIQCRQIFRRFIRALQKIGS